jgi:hypothetical protein
MSNRSNAPNQKGKALDPDTRARLLDLIESYGERVAVNHTGFSRQTVARAAAGLSISFSTREVLRHRLPAVKTAAK